MRNVFIAIILVVWVGMMYNSLQNFNKGLPDTLEKLTAGH